MAPGPEERASIDPDDPLRTDLTLAYDSDGLAAAVAASVRREVDPLEDERSDATVDRDGETVTVRIRAADPVALRAATNTWCSLLEVAERAAVAGSESGGF
ncbi:MAG: KEOPS complex subunit Pcc1 [Halobacteriaceae archaeon]